MTKDKAEVIAQECANRRNEDYCAVQSKNGQWLVERREFMEGVGKVLHPASAKRMWFTPKR